MPFCLNLWFIYQKSIVGGTWYQCVADCMVAAYDWWGTNCDIDPPHSWQPVCYMYNICQPEYTRDSDRTSWNFYCMGSEYPVCDY